MTIARARLLLATAALCAALGGYWLAQQLDRASPRLASGTWLPQPRAVRDFRLTDTAGRAFPRAELAGGPTLVFFGFTHCPDVCPTTLFEISEVLKAMGKDADRVNAYYISVDPDRDTAAAMKEYLSSFDPRLKGLTGSPEQIAKVISSYRVYAKKVPLKDGDYTMDHTALTYLMDRDGKFVSPFNLNRKPDEAAADLAHYL